MKNETVYIVNYDFGIKDFEIDSDIFDCNEVKKLTNNHIKNEYDTFVPQSNNGIDYVVIMPHIENALEVSVVHDFEKDEFEYNIDKLVETFSIDKIGKITDELISISKKILKNIDKRNEAISAKYVFIVTEDDNIYLKDSIFKSINGDIIVEAQDINKKYMQSVKGSKYSYPTLSVYSDKYFNTMLDFIQQYGDQDVEVMPYNYKYIIKQKDILEGDYIPNNRLLVLHKNKNKNIEK